MPAVSFAKGVVMPSLPTSLILVGLAAAWLVVLVPMVARRREEVPENDDESVGFRVVGRTERRVPVMSRTAMARGDDRVGFDADSDDVDGVGDVGRLDAADGFDDVDEESLVEDLVDEDRFGSSRGDAEDVDLRKPARRAVETPVVERVIPAPSGREARRYDDTRSDSLREYDDLRRQRETERRTPVREGRAPVREGRGGFDPAAADRARAQRFRQRQRMALVLFVLTLVGVGLGLLAVPGGYIGAVVAGSLLVLYFAYLRRQVRIEESIRARRSARLERARQIRPAMSVPVAGFAAPVGSAGSATSVGRTVRAGVAARSGAGTAVRAAAPTYRSHARPETAAVAYGRGVPVDLEDGDPAFDDLEYYRPAVYRRRAG